MEAYAMYLMIVAGAHLDILAIRLEALGHEMSHDKMEVDPLQINLLEKSFRIDCLQAYAKISR